MIEWITRAAWLALAIVHLAPAAVVVQPGLVGRLYGVAPDGDLALILRHRGMLFLALVIVSLYATFDPPARKAASLAVATSVIGFLWLYMAAALPAGPLRAIARVDAVALLPLCWVFATAWLVQTA